MEIGELGGQLGVAKEDLLDFTRVIADLGETTNLSTEEAAVSLARFSNVMGTPAEKLENLGSAVVALGNNLETNERDIVSFGERIAGAGKIAGLTESQVFSIGAAMSSVGVQAEAGGTAVQKVLLAMNSAAIEGGDQMEIFAAVSGLSAEEFGVAWEEDAGGVFNEFVNGLGLAGDDALGILSALGLEDQRLIRSFLSLAGAGDKLTEAMEIGNVAFADGTALADEAALRYQTTEAQFAIFKNTIKDVGITIGQTLLPFVNDLLDAAKPLIADFSRKVPGAMKKILPVIKNLIKFGDKLIGVITGLIKSIVHVFTQGELLHMGDFIPGFQEFPQLAQDIINKVRDIFVGLIDFVTGTVIPKLREIWNWFSVFLPQAIATLSAFWTGTLLPAIQTLAEYFSANLKPALIAVGTVIVVALVPAVYSMVAAGIAFIAAWFPIIALLTAIGAAVFLLAKAWEDDFGGIQTKTKEAWESTIKPVLENIKEWIANVVIPAVAKLAEWLKENIPKAMEAVKQFWESTLKPALEAIWEFIQDPLIPIIESVFNWLAEKIPEAFEAIKQFWEDTLEPTLQKIWDFIRDNVIPIVEKFFDWLSVKIPEAFTMVQSFWNDTLKPTLEELWEFIQDPVIVWIEKAFNWLSEKIPEAFAIIEMQWNEILKPTLEKIWKFIKDPLIVWFSKVWSWIAEKVPEAFEDLLQFWISGGGRRTIELIAGGVGAIVKQLKDVVEWVKQAMAALKSWKPPSINLPSLPWQNDDPDPTQQHQGGFWPGGGLAQLHSNEVVLPLGNRAGIRALGAAMREAMAPSLGMPAEGIARGGAGREVNITLAPTINSEMDMRVFEQRVIKIVTDNVG
jgi:TP901 family phage tail tape measure protein